MQNTATHCNTLGLSGYSPDESQNRAVCNTLQYMCTPTGASNSTYCWGSATRIAGALQHTATAHCNTLHYTTAHCNTQCRHSWQTWTSAGSLAGSLQQHTAPQQQCTATHRNTRQRTATHDNTLQHTTTQCNTQHRRSWQPGSSASNTHKFVSTYAHTLTMIQNLYDAHATEGKIYDRREGGSFVGEVGK